jgi:L-ascorbate metabolism protein UlaG (beta-lactamase superfamily)
MLRLILTTIILAGSSAALAQETYVQYLANEGVMVTHEETRILFDPLYRNSFNTYQMVPDEIRTALLAGEPPYGGVDAVFISHYHGDHFSAEDILELLKANDGIRLYAPAQAVAGLREIATDEDAAVFDRVVGLDLEYGDPPVTMRTDDLLIEAVFIPHAGWPTARTDVQNIAFRVTLADQSTVLHLGDADARVVHFTTDADYWEQRTVDLAMPPYWFFESEDGIELLEYRMTVLNAVGIHVPAKFATATNIPADLRLYDLFTHPGEGRRFEGTQ